MVRLGRVVRFSIDPFLEHDRAGFNSYASNPSGEGLALYLELAVELTGPIRPETGLLVNVTEIDQVVRESVVPVLSARIRECLRGGAHIPLDLVARIVLAACAPLCDRLGAARVDRMILQLNPFRKLTMHMNESGVMYFSEKFEFAATHTLWNDAFSEQWNVEVFGKCANRTGHGHNYLVEVTVKTPAGGPPLHIGAFEQTVDTRLMELIDHKNLNVDVAQFRECIATVENLAVFAWQRLVDRFQGATLHCVTVWESDRTYCSYYGPKE